MSITEDIDNVHVTKRRKLSQSTRGRLEVTGQSDPPSNYRTGKMHLLTLLVDELSAEVRPNYDLMHSRLEETLHRVKRILQEIPDRPAQSLTKAEKSIRDSHGLTIPFSVPRPTTDTRYAFEYKHPHSIDFVGSVPNKLFLRKETKTIDMAVTMPPSLFQTKDYLNHRALHKRAYYLACMASGILDVAKEEFSLTYEYQDDLTPLPNLILSSTPRSSPGFLQSKSRIRLIVALPEAIFPIAKTLPDRNCVRPSGMAPDTDKLQPTPRYNGCIRTISSIQTCQNIVRSALSKCESFADACRLGRIWLRQRNLASALSKGGFGSFEWTMTCALLLQTGGQRGQPLLSSKYSSLQLFKAMLQFLSGKDLTNPLILNSTPISISKTRAPVLYDGSTGMNVLFKMTPWSYQILRSLAASSIKAVNTQGQDCFETIFVSKSPTPLLQYDEILTVDLTAINNAREDFLLQETGFDHDIYKTLIRGFDDRVKLLNLATSGSNSWSVYKAPPGKRDDKIYIQIQLNSEHAGRLVDHGPPAEDTVATEEFRRFWGQKAELRRFKDGTISESLVWTDEPSITAQIAQHLLSIHHDVNTKSTVDTGLEKSVLSGQNHEMFSRAASKTFQELTALLHNLSDLPLRVRTVLPASPYLSGSAFDPMQPEPISVQIQFDSSAAWPDALSAIQMTKIAFLVKLADALDSSHQSLGLLTRVGLENQSPANSSSGFVNWAYLDVIYPSSSASSGLATICFRLRVHVEREETLLGAIQSDKSIHGALRDDASTALLIHKRTFSATPTHTTTIRSLCTRHIALSETIKLTKKWISSHLLSNHLPEPIIELLATIPFVRTTALSSLSEAPATATLAFLRVLNFLSHWDWATTPLILDLSSDGESLAPASAEDLRQRFQAWRKIDPNFNKVVVFNGTNIDPTGVVWTQMSPRRGIFGSTNHIDGVPAVIMSRLCALATASIQIVEQKGLDMKMSKDDWKSLFTTPMGDYDFLIRLKPAVIRNHERHRDGNKTTSRFKNIQLQLQNPPVAIEEIVFDAVETFLQDLQHCFDKTCMFFYNHHHDKGHVIGGLWRPEALGQKQWRVGLGWNVRPVPVVGRKETKEDNGEGEGEKKEFVVVNQHAILAEIAALGEGLVEKIEVVKELEAGG